jgi:hypothetical protein
MTRKWLYWLEGGLYLIFLAGTSYFLHVHPYRPFATIFLIGSTIITMVIALHIVIRYHPPQKDTIRHTLYWFGSALFVVLQTNLFVSDFIAPHSLLRLTSIIGATILMAAYAMDLIIQMWPQIRDGIKKLRRPPLDD